MRMTGDVPPQPFLDLRRPRIAQRVIAAELLRRAFLTRRSAPGVDPEEHPRHVRPDQLRGLDTRPRSATGSASHRRSPLVVRRLTAFTGLDEGAGQRA